MRARGHFVSLASAALLFAAWPVAVGAEARPGEQDDDTSKSQQTELKPSGKGSIVAIVKGFRNRKGQLLLAVFDSEEGFPNGVKHAIYHEAFPIEGAGVRVRVADLAPGTYAVAVHHDEDGDFEMDTGFFGIPREGFGASNDAPARFGPPKFKHARFELREGQERKLPINVRYF